MTDSLHLGIDVGSKTVKIVVIGEDGNLLFSIYNRHLTNVRETLMYALADVRRRYPHTRFTIGVTGSAGIQLAEMLHLPFVQEVVASKLAIERLIPGTDVAIELGGEDSKILFLSGGEELRMNATCAGGTGGFIDTIAGMLDLNAGELNNLAYGCTTVYPIASRCAVFAQADVRPLLNEGVSKADIAGSVLNAVAVQCVSGLACGRPIRGKVVLLGGPMHFLSALRLRFKEVLGSEAREVFAPPEAHLFVARGAAFHAWNGDTVTVEQVMTALAAVEDLGDEDLGRLPPLFATSEEYDAFRGRHVRDAYPRGKLSSYQGDVYLGVDSGSVSLKCALIGSDEQILYSYYKRSAGDLITAAKDMFADLYKHLPLNQDGTPTVRIAHATVTGYGEGLLKSAFMIDSGEVETVAHLRSAQKLMPDVTFVLDIGGQDIKSMFVRDGYPVDVVLNEACSSGCGALLSGFAYSMNIKLSEFVERALFAERPVDLGTRCTVFMTSRVRHAQKEGASAGEIAAGLAFSVVKNALYKVIRVSDLSALGEHIVVQGGTFRNDSVLRAFELLSGREVVRPESCEFAGAYGAALIAKERAGHRGRSSLLDASSIKALVCRQSTERCRGCTNACLLTINDFCSEKGTECRRFVMGNRCQRGAAGGQRPSRLPNLYDYKYRRLFAYESLPAEEAPRGEIGIIRALRTYEDYPFWHTFLTELGYRVVLSDASSRDVYRSGAETIPSESACYPAKIAHGHVMNLVAKGVRRILLPRSAVADDGLYPCPVLDNYALVLSLNIDALREGEVEVLSPRVDSDSNWASVLELGELSQLPDHPTRSEVANAFKKALRAQAFYRDDIRRAGEEALRRMKEMGAKGVVLAGRPYHVDPEMHHALPELLGSYGLAVLTQDSVAHLADLPDGLWAEPLWEYPTEAYRAANFVAQREDLHFIQLYSFGCGLDAVSTDQIRDLLESQGKTYMSLKIDEMSDLGATRIRVRSMLAALANRESEARCERQVSIA